MKICPLMTIARAVDGGRESCMEEDCGWWNEKVGICSIRLIAGVLVSRIPPTENQSTDKDGE